MINQILATGFSERILPFDKAAAEIYATIAAQRKSGGRTVEPLDTQIAAIARAHGAALATRSQRDFEETGVELIDPWSA